MHPFLAGLALSRSASVALAISLCAVLLGASRASAVPPANDLCSTPALLPEGVVAGPFSTLEAADDYAPGCVALDGPDTVHEFTLTSDAATLVVLTPQTPQWGLVAALRTSEGCTARPDLACVADGFDERYINAPHLTAGTYDVLVDGKSGASGSYTIEYHTGALDTTFGYWQTESLEPFETISGSDGAVEIGIPLSTSADLAPGDEWSRTVTLPFIFDYYGTSYSAVHVNSNMFLTFDTPPTGSEAWSNDCLDDSEPSNAVAVFWDDGVSHEDGPSSLWTKVEGTAPDRRFIIEYIDWGVFSSPPQFSYLDLKLNQQVVLYEDGDIEFRYGSRNAPGVSVGCGTQQSGCSATIGIEGTTPVRDTDLAYCETDGSVYDGLAIRFVHPSAPNAVPPAPVPAMTSRSTHVALALLLLAIGLGALVRSAWAPLRRS